MSDSCGQINVVEDQREILYGREREQDCEEVGGHEVHLSPQIHQEYIIRHRSACRTPAEGRQEYLASGKEYIEPYKLKIKA